MANTLNLFPNCGRSLHRFTERRVSSPDESPTPRSLEDQFSDFRGLLGRGPYRKMFCR